MRYLFLVTEKYSANGICVKAVMQKLISEGHQVDCISNMEFDEPHYFCKYGISYYGIRPRLVYNISSRILRSKDNRFIKYIISLFGFVFNKIQLLLAIPTWPVISRGYSKRIYLQAKQLYEKRHYDYIIPVYTQIDTIIAAKKIKEKYPEIKYVPYFLDSLAGGYGPKMFSKEWIIKRGLKWERKLLQNADLIIMMQSSKNFYNSKKDILFYFDKIRFLDIPLFNPICSIESETVSTTDKKHIVYVGSIPAYIRNPQYFLDVFTSLKRTDIDLTIIGSSTCEHLLNDYCARDKRIKRLQQVSHEEALRWMNNADILLNLGNNLTTMIPSKIFEYMSLGKPIISTAPIKDEPCIPYLSKYKYACIIDENESFEVESSKLDEFISNAKTLNPYELIDVFYLNTADAFVETINNLK
ncbi:MAG: glycosyltransferase [Sodaliphilus sp.]|nr:glycosyltransferase [Sodaliphilus sp.]